MRNKAYIWLPLAMLIYTVAMALAFKADLLGEKRYFQFYGTLAIQIIVILLLYVFLRKKSRLRDSREAADEHYDSDDNKPAE